MTDFVGAIDLGTSSGRFLIFDVKNGEVITYEQIELHQFFPQDGWVEQDPLEYLDCINNCIAGACNKLVKLGHSTEAIKTVGITNQRETLVVWDKFTGKPLHNAIVWMDSRAQALAERFTQSSPSKNPNHLQPLCGLPFSSYFTALKLVWLIENDPAIHEAIQENRCLIGTPDTWLLWKLTGNHATDVTNASRTMLMNLHTLSWDKRLCDFFKISMSVLPTIKSCSDDFGAFLGGPLKGIPVNGVVGDQQAALLGHGCLKEGQLKNTYGTGNFLLVNTGDRPVLSEAGLLTTVAYRRRNENPSYALEGSVATAGQLIRWLRDGLGILATASEVEILARSVESSEGVSVVPAFTGLLCPQWRPDARAVITGLSPGSTKCHIAYAALEGVANQVEDVLDVMRNETGFPIETLRVDGGMTANSLLMQIQADISNVKVERPSLPEATALGAALAAAAYSGLWNPKEKSLPPCPADTWSSQISAHTRSKIRNTWNLAMAKCLMKAPQQPEQPDHSDLVQLLPFSAFGLVSFAMLIFASSNVQ